MDDRPRTTDNGMAMTTASDTDSNGNVDMIAEMLEQSMTQTSLVGAEGGDGIGRLVGLSIDGDRGGSAEESTPPRLVHCSPTARTYRSGRTEVIKVVEDASLADRERRVSDFLPPSCPVRRVTRAEARPDRGAIALHFDWVEGSTMKEWLCGKGGRPGRGSNGAEDLKSRLRAAIAIAKALCDLHDAGAAHGNLTASHVVIETFRGGGCAVTLIDLSRSIIFADAGAGGGEGQRGAAVRADLRGLGRIYQGIFGGGYGQTGGPDDKPGGMAMDTKKDDRETYGHERKKRGKSSTRQDDAVEVEGMPLYLASLISALIAEEGDARGGSSSGRRYETAGPVFDDLLAALDGYDVYFRPFDWKEASLCNHHMPVPPSAFYGRRTEASMLVNSLNSVIQHGQPMMTVVSGHAGMGKTTLAKQITKAVEGKGGYIIRSKFDMADGSRPDSVLFEALNDFFGMFVKTAGEDQKAQMKQRIAGTVRSGIGDLVKSIPNLARLVDGGDFNSSFMMALPQEMLHRSKYFLCKLIGAISNERNPIVLLFDDLQWCDETTLSVIETIATDPDVQFVLYAGCYRDDEPSSKSVVTMIDDVKRQGVNVLSINLGSFEKESVNTMISESLCLPPSLSKPLSEIIHTKTAGSPLFCSNFLSDGLIRFNLTTRRWEYDIETILMKEIPQSVVQYMKNQMSKLPLSYLLVLKLASCLGDHFDHATFLRAKVRSDYDLESVLPSVCQIGFIHEISPGEFLWAHDQVREAAYALIPENMRESFHLLIGTRLLMNTDPDDLDTSIFSILSQMNKGIRLIQTSAQKYDIARLNLEAGESCIKMSSFHSAAEYFMNGIKLLPQDCWGCEYELALELHDAAQDALFATGDLPSLFSLGSEVIKNAKTFDHKLNSYKNRVRYFISLQKMEESISTCISVLNELGEEVPAQFSDEVLFHEFMTLRTMLGQYSGQDILGLKQMTDARKLAAMEFMQSIVSAGTNCADPRVVVVVSTRLVKTSLDYGLCDVAAFAFATFGSMLIHGKIKDLDGGYFYGNLAIKLLDVLGAKRFKARVFTIVYGFINIWRDPLQASLECLMDGYHAGCVHGDMEYAYWSLQSYSGLALYTGQELNSLGNNLRTYAKRAMQSKQMGAVLGIVPFLSAVVELTLSDASKEDVYKSFFNVTEDVLFEQLPQDERRARMLMMNNQKFACLYKGDLDGALEAYELNSTLTGEVQQHQRTLPRIIGIFVDGLIAFSCARNNGEDVQKWVDVGECVMETVKEWAEISKWNFENKLNLLEAEYFFIKENALALEKYEASIAAARKHRLVHEEGLALSLCGHYHLAQGSTADAKQNFTKAKYCYQRWGARCLAENMETMISSIS